MNSYKQKTLLSRLLPFIRIFLGLVFIFSSVVKGIDPVGTSYRVEDYLLVYGWTSLVPYALWIAFLVIFSEFLIGISFLFKIFIRTAAGAMLLMLIFFTVVTWLDARYNMVTDCGCFGDAVKLTNWQTFYKNIFLIFLYILFLWGGGMRWRERPKFLPQFLILTILGAGFLGFMFYNLNHLPVIDFRNWKTGRNMTMDTTQKAKTYVIYRNKKTGAKKEFLFPDYPWKDTAWMNRWAFVSQRTVAPSVGTKYNLVIEDSLGNDRTKAIIENPGFQFILVSFDMSRADADGLKKAAALSNLLNKKGISMLLLTATERKTARRIEIQYGLQIPVFQADETDLKAMIRSNPGLLLLHHGVILKKWHYHDFPGSRQIKKFLISPAQ